MAGSLTLRLRRKFVWGRQAAAGVLAATALLCTVRPASAQIYSWRDASGTLVLSNRRPATSEAKTFAVAQADSVRVTRYADPDHLRDFDDLLAEHARLNGVRLDLVRAVVQVESGFNPRARSPKGALGLMQLMPATIRDFGVRNPFNPAENVRAGVAYLRQLLNRYENDEQLALAAYNAGPGNVDRHGQSVPPFKETQAYVARIGDLSGRAVQPRGAAIYKSTDVVDGREVPRYSDHKPSSGSYEVVH